MTWFDDPSVIRFDVHAGTQACRMVPLHRTARPAGDDGHGTGNASRPGRTVSPCVRRGQGRFEAVAPLPRAAVVALRVMPETGFCGAAVFPEPIRLECGPGVSRAGRLVEDGRAGVLLRRCVVSQDRHADARSRPAAESRSTWGTWSPRPKSA